MGLGGYPYFWRLFSGVLLLSASACGADESLRRGRDGGTEGAGDAGDGADGGRLPGDDASAPVRVLSVEPANATLAVDGSEEALEFTALLNGSALGQASWSIDNPRLGSIDAAGVFHATGKVAGSTVVTARFGDLMASTILTVTADLTLQDDAVTNEQRDALDGAAGGSDASFRWLYPYDGTVFPRGLPSPDLQFDGGAADALRISVVMGGFSFVGYFPGSARAAATLPADIWDALTASSDGSEPVTVEVKKLHGTSVVGPISQSWQIAAGDLKGIIYYNTYKSAQTSTGAVMRIKPGEDAEVLLGMEGCTVCHSVSAQGNVLAAGFDWGDNGNPVDSVSFDLLDDGSAPERYSGDEGRSFPFAGLTPDGRWLISNGVPADSPVRGLFGREDDSNYSSPPDPLPSRLHDTQTGAEIAAPSFTDAVQFAVTPAFSPDAKRLAFSWYDQGQGKTLAMMDVDLTTNPPAFAPPQQVTSVSSGIVGWPSFFPDGKGIVYQEGDRFDTVGWGPVPSYAELRLADTEANVVNPLARLNGWRAADESYLPHGKDEENRRNYEPSVLPVPVGGYYWVLFTSRRAYGHTLAPGGTVAGSDNEWGTMVNNVETPSLRKKLWVAAIDIDYSGKADPSHPAFYLPGQELLAGNMRAYAALEPCRAEGDACGSGADCCGGFCRLEENEFGEPAKVCVPPPVGCSNVDESCETDADCCGVAAGDRCINNRCAAPNVSVF